MTKKTKQNYHPLPGNVAAPNIQQPLILHSLILSLTFHTDLARPCVGIIAHIWCQMNKLKFVIMKAIHIKKGIRTIGLKGWFVG